MGRPGPAPRFTQRVPLYVSPAARRALEQLAERNDRYLSQEVRAALAAHLQRPHASLSHHEPIGNPPWARICVVIRPQTYAEINELADRAGRTMAAEMRIAVDHYLREAAVTLPQERQPTLLTA